MASVECIFIFVSLSFWALSLGNLGWNEAHQPLVGSVLNICSIEALDSSLVAQTLRRRRRRRCVSEDRPAEIL